MSEHQQDDGPELLPGNHGRGVAGKLSFTDGQRNWEERIDVLELAARAMHERGHTVLRRGRALDHADGGYLILPQLVDAQWARNGHFQTLTTIQVHHPRLAPAGVFEYQHSTGTTLEDSLFKGFDQWAQIDLVTLLDAARPKPAECTVMEMSFPDTPAQAPRVRRAILGPVGHFALNPPAKDPAEEHPFCACCLLTRSFEAFKPLLESDEFCGLRLFAMRDENGAPAADCRVNGNDFEPGAAALRAYVKTWRGTGIEFRKQYVVLHTVAGTADATTVRG